MYRPLLATLVLSAALLGGAADAPPRDMDDYVRITLDPPGATPFRMIRYEITTREPATTAVHRRLLPGHDEGLHSLGLLTAAEARAVDDLVRATDALNLPDAAPARVSLGDLAWRVELQVAGRAHRFRVVAPENLPDRRYHRLIDGVRRAVLEHAGELPFRNVFFAPSDRGWVNIASVPTARVWIGGFDTQLDTPLYHYELGAGTHEVRLRSADGQHDRTYEVRVEPGGTTNLRVDLR